MFHNLKSRPKSVRSHYECIINRIKKVKLEADASAALQEYIVYMTGGKKVTLPLF